jgi:hypothetical protein
VGRVGGAGLEQRLAVYAVRVGLFGGQEAGAQHGARGPERQRGGDAAAVGDPAGRDHRHIADRVHDGGDEHHRGHLPAHVAPGLPALGDDYVDAGVDGSLCFLDGPDGVHDAPAGRAYLGHIAPFG